MKLAGVSEPEQRWHFVLYGEPVAKERPRHGRGRTYTPASTTSAENAWRTQMLAGKPHEPIEHAAFAVQLRFYCAGWARKDIDNLVKLVLDACNGVLWADDRQVVGVDAWVYRGADGARTELSARTVDQPIAAPKRSAGSARRLRTTVTPRQLRQAVQLMSDGLTATQAADEIGVTPTALSRAIAGAGKSRR